MKSVPVLMPQMGQSIAEGTVVKWHKQVGDAVKADELLVEVESDKIAFEVGSPASGVLTACLTGEGELAEVGSGIGLLETEDDAIGGQSTTIAAERTSEHEQKQPVLPVRQSVPDARSEVDIGALPEITRDWLSPSVARLALINNVTMKELRTLRGTGTQGRVTRNDLLTYLAQRPSEPAAVRASGPQLPPRTDLDQLGHVVPMTTMRKTIADHMVQSIHTSAHVTMVHAIDVTQVVALRKMIKDEFRARYGVRMTYTGMMIYLTSRVLRKFPYINASVFGTNIVLREEINIGCAVATPDESLVVPVIRNADKKSFLEIATDLERVVALARSKALKRDDVEDGTFTISNFGTFGSLFGTPIINQPQVAILGMGAVTRLPVLYEGEVQVRDHLFLSFSFDHRVIDGAVGGRFLNTMQETVEDLTLEELKAALM